MSEPAQVVAIVDDDAAVRIALARLLRDFGYKTELYSSAELYMSRSATSEATCVILDIHLGGVSGIEMRRWLTALQSRQSVIFMTGANDDQLRNEATAVGCTAFLTKPLSSDSVIDAVRKATNAPSLS